MTLPEHATVGTDDCYRCGYALHGIADDQPCPECGLLARRSRRVTDDLHRTRPRWLRRITIGVVLLLVAIVMIATLPLTGPALDGLSSQYLGALRWAWLRPFMPLSPMTLGTPLLFGGTWFLTSREGYAPADHDDRRRRRALRTLATLAVVGFAPVNVHLYFNFQGRPLPTLVRGALTALEVLVAVGMVPLPLLLFAHLRSLAKRVRSAHLAEHCTIVGTGTSATLFGFVLASILSNNAEWIGMRRDWINRSPSGIAVVTLLIVSFALFGIWSVYLLARFGIAFRIAARALRREWHGDDRSLAPPPSQAAT
jgi:hypothetical protein